MMSDNVGACQKQIREIIKYSALAYKKNLVSAAGGNVSARSEKGIFITGSSAPLRELNPEDIVLCDMDGTVLESPRGRKASKETPFHLNVYRLRPDINYVMHLHPGYSIAWSIENDELPLYTESAKLKLKKVPFIPDMEPGSARLANAVYGVVGSTDSDINSYIMKNHGILVMGKTMEDCYDQAELLEDTAKIAIIHGVLTNRNL